MPAINFKPQFAPLVESGAKTQTIRKANRFKIGDTVQLYTGQRTNLCRKLGEGVVEVVLPFYISRSPMLCRDAYAAIAKADGFANAEEMVDWFEKQHGLPFEGWLIRWRLIRMDLKC